MKSLSKVSDSIFQSAAVAAIRSIGLDEESTIEAVVNSLSRSSDLAISLRQPKRKGSLGQIVFFYQDVDSPDFDKKAAELYEKALICARAYVDAFNRMNTAHFEIVTNEKTDGWVLDDDDDTWSQSTIGLIGIRHKKASFFRRSDVYLSGIASNMFEGFIKVLGIEEA